MLKKLRKQPRMLGKRGEQIVQEHLPFALVEVLLDFAAAGRVVTKAELPVLATVVTNILRNEVLRAREAQP